MPAKKNVKDATEARKPPAPWGASVADMDRKVAILRDALARFGLPTDAAIKPMVWSPFTSDWAPDSGAPAAGRRFRMAVKVPWPEDKDSARRAMAAALSIEDAGGRAVVDVSGRVATILL